MQRRVTTVATVTVPHTAHHGVTLVSPRSSNPVTAQTLMYMTRQPKDNWPRTVTTAQPINRGTSTMRAADSVLRFIGKSRRAAKTHARVQRT